jgi:hypothetical protein
LCAKVEGMSGKHMDACTLPRDSVRVHQ